jgi:hypothetical protein
MITLPGGYRHAAVARALVVATLLATVLPLHAAEQSLRSLLPGDIQSCRIGAA